MAEMNLILASLLWRFVMTLPAERRQWGSAPAAEPVNHDSGVDTSGDHTTEAHFITFSRQYTTYREWSWSGHVGL